MPSYRAVSIYGDREQQFYCAARRRLIAVGDCLEDYLDANALRRHRSRCYRCMQGRAVRAAWSTDRLTDGWPTPSGPQVRASGPCPECGKTRVSS